MTGRAERVGTYTALGLFAVAVIYPILSILFLALHRKSDLVTGFAFPTRIDLSSFEAAWSEGNFALGFRNSFVVAAAVTAATAVLSTASGYAFALTRMRGARIVFPIILLGLVFPYEAAVIPLYYDFRSVHLLNTYGALILPQVAQGVCFGTFWMRAFFRSVPRGLVEAGRIDGANSLQVLVRILLPQARPALTTLAALIFTFAWNEFLLALVLVSENPARQTAPLGLSLFAGAVRATDPTKVAAAAMLVAAPILVAYVAFQRQFIRGMLAGALKE